MDREIIFRGQHFNNKWFDGDLIHGVGSKEGKLYILPLIKNLAYIPEADPLDGIEVRSSTVGQYTGMTDKNGVKIFEGDVVQIKEFDSLYEIVFHDGCFKLVHLRKDMNRMIWGTLERIKELEHKYPFKVIGNIHHKVEIQNEVH